MMTAMMETMTFLIYQLHHQLHQKKKKNEFNSEFDCDDEKLTSTQEFLLDKPQKEKLAAAVGENRTFAPQPQEKNNSKKC